MRKLLFVLLVTYISKINANMKILEYPIFYNTYINIYLLYTKSVLITTPLFWGEFHPTYLQGSYVMKLVARTIINYQVIINKLITTTIQISSV